MYSSSFKTVAMLIAIVGFSQTAFAQDDAGQNAATRALKEPLTGIAAAVPNPKIVPCYNVVDCREKGRDLETVWQLNIQANSAADISAHCPMPAKSGKYAYMHSACL